MGGCVCVGRERERERGACSSVWSARHVALDARKRCLGLASGGNRRNTERTRTRSAPSTKRAAPSSPLVAQYFRNRNNPKLSVQMAGMDTSAGSSPNSSYHACSSALVGHSTADRKGRPLVYIAFRYLHERETGACVK